MKKNQKMQRKELLNIGFCSIVGLLLLFFVMGGLVGCGDRSESVSSEGSQGLTSQGMSPQGERGWEWPREVLAEPKEVRTDQELWAGEYLPVTHAPDSADAEEDWYCADSGVFGRLIWHLCKRSAEGREADGRHILETYDCASGESTVKSFTPSDLGLTGGEWFVDSMEMLDDSHFVFRWMNYEQDGEGMYHQTRDVMVYTDLAGETRLADLWEVFLEKGIESEMEGLQPIGQTLDWACDGEGNFCVIKGSEGEGSQAFLFDRNGEFLGEEEFDRNRSIGIEQSFRTPEGDLIFAVYDVSGERYDFLQLDAGEGQLRSVSRAGTKSPFLARIYCLQGTELYYLDGTAVMKWDLESRERELVFDLAGAGLALNYDTRLALAEGRPPVLFLSRYKEGRRMEWLAPLQTEPGTSEALLVADLVCLPGASELAETCVNAAAMNNPAFSYTYESDGAEEARTRVLAELAGGEGPDLMVLSLEDMRTLAEKGALMDLGELLSEELLEELLPGALEIGTIDGKLWGIPPAVTARTLLVGGEAWPEDSWELEDVAALMEGGKVTGVLRMDNGIYLDPALSVILLVNEGLWDSFLIDREAGECHFDDERFVRLLKACGTDMSKTPADGDSLLNGGKDIVLKYVYGVSDLFQLFEQLEAEGGHVVGLPGTGTGAGCLEAAGGVLAVSAKADPKAAAYFLETLLGKEIQSKSLALAMGVRKPVPEDYVTEDEEGRLLYKTYNRDHLTGELEEVPVFADGSNPYRRAEEFLLDCRAASFQDSRIKKVLAEELDEMYGRGRSVEDTAEIINGRVRLILSEDE